MDQSAARMSRDATVVDAWTTLREAVMLMSTLQVGVLMVCRNGRLIGAVAQSDVVLRLPERVAPTDRPLVEGPMRTEFCFPEVSLGQALEHLDRNEACRVRIISHARVMLEAVSLSDPLGSRNAA
jgi:CBS-domain-containing membrane protein